MVRFFWEMKCIFYIIKLIIGSLGAPQWVPSQARQECSSVCLKCHMRGGPLERVRRTLGSCVRSGTVNGRFNGRLKEYLRVLRRTLGSCVRSATVKGRLKVNVRAGVQTVIMIAPQRGPQQP